uniref:Phospholipid scramblase n=2 Tax=Caenorhabditis tropicalis TaxID=1561998 RepID=A0A1I7TU50_9PELO
MRPIITTQPGFQPPQSGWMPLPQGFEEVPTGLEYLTYLDTVMIHNIRDPIGDRNKKYKLKNSNGEQVLFAFQKLNGFITCDIHFINGQGIEVLTMKRETKYFLEGCYGWGSTIGCHPFECTIRIPSMGPPWIIRQRPQLKTTSYDVLDGDENAIFQIDGPCCCRLLGCKDMEFQIRKSNEMIGEITRKWTGFTAQVDHGLYSVTFSSGLDVISKALLLSAAIFIDISEFPESQNRYR